MKNRYINVFMLCFIFAGVLVAAEKPNVIVILADDLGYADVGFHDEVADGVYTPNLNRLADEGVTFGSAYAASPVCSNSRLALSTGRYQHRWGAYYYGQGGMPTAEFTIAEMMREAGYRTCKVGKTHLNKGPKEYPTKHGFDQFLGFLHHSWDFELLSQKDVDAYERKKEGSTKEMNQCPIGPMFRDEGKRESFENTTTTEVFGKESVRFIEEESDKPFYLQLEFNAVHTPLTRCPKQYRKKYGVPDRAFDRDAVRWDYPLWEPTEGSFKDWYGKTCHLKTVDPYGRAIYLAHLELMDAEIGRILDLLDQRGLRENTLVFFSVDNGGSDQSYANNGSIHGFKYSLMDGGVKVPMVLSWPARLKQGAAENALVTHRDLFATLSEITAVPPKNPLDGKSLLPLLNGDVQKLHEDPMFWDSGKKQQNWIVRDGDWKLVYFGNGRTYQTYELGEDGLVKPELKKVAIPAGMKLFNMKEDPFESENLVDAFPEKVAYMEKLHADWRAGMADEIRGTKQK